MQAEMYEIVPCPQGRLAVAPRPRGDEWLMGELASFRFRGVTDVVSLLPPEEELSLGLQKEAEFCGMLNLRFHRLPVLDRSVPLQPAFDEFISSLLPFLQQGGYLLIHCRAGIGRSALTVAALLIRLGISADEAIYLISEARGWDIPDTNDQYDFIQSLGHQDR